MSLLLEIDDGNAQAREPAITGSDAVLGFWQNDEEVDGATSPALSISWRNDFNQP
jgi:hypothetical protein